MEPLFFVLRGLIPNLTSAYTPLRLVHPALPSTPTLIGSCSSMGSLLIPIVPQMGLELGSVDNYGQSI